MSWKNEQVSSRETEEILRCARDVLGAGVLGDFVEMGCYRGDTALLLAEVLKEYERDLRPEQGWCGGKPVENSVEEAVEKVGKNDDLVVEKMGKRLWIYDSFEGLPEKSVMDESVLGVDFRKGELMVTKREVKERFLRAGLKVPVIKKGWFRDLGARDMPDGISFAFLDGDFYESTRDSLRLVENLMADGGKLLIHDYNNPALPGVKKAVKEWCAGRDLKMRVVGSMVVIEI